MTERILGAVFLITLASLGMLAANDETHKDGWCGMTPNKKAAISSDSLTNCCANNISNNVCQDKKD